MSEIILNALQDGIASALAKMFQYPLNWIHVALAAIAILARGQNVIDSVTSSFFLGNKVVLMQRRVSIKQRGRIATISANATPPFQGILPVYHCEITWQNLFFGSSTQPCVCSTLRIPVLPIFCCRLLFVRVCLTPSSFALSCLFRILETINATTFFFLFTIILTVNPVSLMGALKIVLVSASLVFINNLWFVFLSFVRFLYTTFATVRRQAITVLFVSIKMWLGLRKILAAVGTALEWERVVDHDASLSSNLRKLLAGGEISHFSGATLANNLNCSTVVVNLPII